MLQFLRDVFCAFFFAQNFYVALHVTILGVQPRVRSLIITILHFTILFTALFTALFLAMSITLQKFREEHLTHLQ